MQIANCKLVFLYVSVCITPKGRLLIAIISAYKVIIYYYNIIINNIIYIILLITSENNKENIEFAICNLQFAIFLAWIIGYRAVIMTSLCYWAVTLLFWVYLKREKRSHSGVIAELHRSHCNDLSCLNTETQRVYFLSF